MPEGSFFRGIENSEIPFWSGGSNLMDAPDNPALGTCILLAALMHGYRDDGGFDYTVDDEFIRWLFSTLPPETERK